MELCSFLTKLLILKVASSGDRCSLSERSKSAKYTRKEGQCTASEKNERIPKDRNTKSEEYEEEEVVKWKK